MEASVFYKKKIEKGKTMTTTKPVNVNPVAYRHDLLAVRNEEVSCEMFKELHF